MPETKIANLINPEVMADMLSAKLPLALKVMPYARIDNTLVGRPGDTITTPVYAYIGDAVDVAEGVAAGTTVLTASSTKTKVKKAVKAVEITDEAVLSGYGDPVGEATSQLVKAIASKLDADGYAALLTAQLKHDAKAKAISYEAIVDAVDKFEEEEIGEKVIFVHPKQVTQLRKDPNFLSADKYQAGVAVSGEIGKIAGARVIPSKRVALDGASAFYTCPIVKLNQDDTTEQETPALTVYVKRAAQVEDDRDILKGTTTIVANEHYGVALSNASKVVLLEVKK